MTTKLLLVCALLTAVLGCQPPAPAVKTTPRLPPFWLFETYVADPVMPAPREERAETLLAKTNVPEKNEVLHWPMGQKSKMLPSGLFNPMPAGVVSGYRADTGLDVMGIKMPVHALASGWIDYAEAGHTLWTGPRDTANCVRIELDEPIAYRGRKITHIYYAHLSKLVAVQEERKSSRMRVEGGDLLGTSGVANGSWHLHLGFLLDGEVEQYRGTFLYEDEIREVLGGYRNGSRLPKE